MIFTKEDVFIFIIDMVSRIFSGVVVFLCIQMQITLGHSGHDHSELVEPIFGQNEIVPDVIDVAPTKELNVN